MNFSILQENLKQGLFITGHIAGKNINLPILNNIKIDIKKGNAKLISTNLEMGITHTIRVGVEEEGEYTVDAKIFTDYINLIPNKKVNIIKDNKGLKVECGNYKTKIKGQVSDDFPLIPQVEKRNYYSVKVNDFKKALSQIVFAVSNNEARLELSGVFFEFNNSDLFLVATDSYRLAEKKIKIKFNGTKDQKDQKVIIPAKTLQELIRILSGLKDGGDINNLDEEIKFYINDNQILFEIKSVELVSRLIEGQYPDYKQIIPNNPKTRIIINRQELLRAVKASALFSKIGINDVNLDFPKNQNQVVVSSASNQMGENIVSIDASVEGKDNGIVVNCGYLLDGLNNIETNDIKIDIVDNNTPCILRPSNNKDGNNYLYIIMPIKQ